MEEFYSNPFNHDPELDELCYANVQSFAPEPSIQGAEVQTDKNLMSVSSTLRYQAQLSEALRTNSTLRSTYEAHIETQRKEIDRLGTENNELLQKVTKLETQIRSLELDKECSAMAYRRETEKNAALAEKIALLETELNSLTRRAQEMNALYGGAQSKGLDTLEAFAHRSRSFVPEQGPPARAAQSRVSEDSRNTSGASPFGSERVVCPLEEPERTALWGPGSHPRRRAGGCPEKREGQADAAAIKELERLLLRECQRKDVLESELQKMERAKIRTGTGRAKKIYLERDLEAVQKTISNVRMKLRALSALER